VPPFLGVTDVYPWETVHRAVLLGREHPAGDAVAKRPVPTAPMRKKSYNSLMAKLSESVP
jgi:hypothetical protein